MNYFDPTKQFEGKKFSVDCREFMILYIITTCQLEQLGKISDDEQNIAIKALDLTMQAMLELPEQTKNIIKTTITGVDDIMNNKSKQEKFKATLQELEKLLFS